ncbi:MAG: AAA family ATPase [Prolixibacteraceae bacterium]|jgi:predicted ATPase|nr:AAA family ATPase [Prolixibacteraceae bacterium]
MITRIKINGFKSLIDIDLYLGPFTCIAGANAIGKSNFFDALAFLSNLADKTIVEAAKSVRSESQKHSNIRDIFFKSGAEYMQKMAFEVDMIIPQKGIDDLGQTAESKITSLRYELELKLNEETSDKEPIEITKEELKPIRLTEARKNIYFEHSIEWLNSVITGKRAGTPFISTIGGIIKLHSDSKERGGRTTEFTAQKMPRTLVSTVTAESPTAFLVRQEMRNWTMLQFEPSALRQPNSIYEVKNAVVTANGLNLPATLFRLNNEKKDKDVYQGLTNRLKGLVEDVSEIAVDKDEKRDLLTLQIKFKSGLTLPAQSLSDGTLRFLGLAIIEEDSFGSSLICLEEPENGINPKKILEMVDLLEKMGTDTEFAVDEDNPLRQVVINTHSPGVVSAVADESLYLAKSKEGFHEEFNKKITYTCFSALKNTWKTNNSLAQITSLGEINAYLDKTVDIASYNEVYEDKIRYQKAIPSSSQKKKTVVENVIQSKIDFGNL